MSDLNLPALAEAGKVNNGSKAQIAMQEINEAYVACGFGWFHIRLLSISFVGFVAGVLVSNSTAYLLPSAECDLDMSLVQKGLLNAIPYSGMLFSTVIAGFLTDTFGRKTFVTLGYGGMFIFMFISASSQTYEVLITAKFFEGILFATSFSAAITLTTEYCHNRIRDRVFLCQSSYGAFSQIVIAAMSWGILTNDWKYSIGNFLDLNTWNFYLYLMSLWALSACLLYFFFIPESPKYLITQNKFNEARAILIKMYVINTGKPADTFPYINLWKEKPKQLEDSSNDNPLKGFRHQLVVGLQNIKPMFRRPLIMYISMICFSNFFTMGIYNVLRLWFPQLSTIVEHYSSGSNTSFCHMLDAYTTDLKAAVSNVTASDVCVVTPSGAETYINSIIVGCVCVLPYFVSGMLINKVGKKPLIVIAGVICVAITLGIQWANSKAAIVSLFAIGTAVTQVLMSLNQAMTVELFPTTIRTLAISLMMLAGRIGTLAANITFPILLDMGCVVPYSTMTGLILFVTILSLFLPSKKK